VFRDQEFKAGLGRRFVSAAIAAALQQRIEVDLLPPYAFIAALMEFTVVSTVVCRD
jgi:hypothetical protein